MTDRNEIFKWASDNRFVPLVKGSEGASLIGVHGETLRTRIRNGKAEANVEPAGKKRNNLSYSLSMMVHNLLFDHLSKFSEDFEFGNLAEDYLKKVLVEGKVDLWLELQCLDGEWVISDLINGGTPDLENTHEPIFLMPIGVMIAKLAGTLHSRSNAKAGV